MERKRKLVYTLTFTHEVDLDDSGFVGMTWSQARQAERENFALDPFQYFDLADDQETSVEWEDDA